MTLTLAGATWVTHYHTRQMGLQRPKIPCENPQSQKKSKIHARENMSGPDATARGLQKDYSQQGGRHKRGFGGTTPQS